MPVEARDNKETLPAWAATLKARRAYLNKSQEQIVMDSDDVLYQTEVSRIERGKLHPVDDLSLPKLFALLKAYEWTLDEFEDATGLEVPVYTPDQADAIEAARHLEVHPQRIVFPVYSAVSAGCSDAEPLDGETVSIPAEKLRQKGAHREHVRVYRVNGDCMISSEAQRIDRNIVHGDYVGVDTRRPPRPGETVVAWWPEDEKLIVKRYKIDEGGIVLYPMAPGHPTVVLPHAANVNLIGVVIYREG